MLNEKYKDRSIHRRVQTGTIKSVTEKHKGKVELEDGQKFENGAGRTSTALQLAV